MVPKIAVTLFLAGCILIFSSTKVVAQVQINEFSSSTSPDWVELYAYEETDISGWKIDDDATSSVMHTVSDGTVLAKGEFYIVDVSNRLNNTGDIISLYTKEDILIESINYGVKGGVCTPSDSESVGKVDNGNTLERFFTPSKGSTNLGATLNTCPTPTPEPTPSPSPTPKPTKTPEPSKAPTATLSPTVKAAATKEPTLKPTSKKLDEDEEDETQKLILGLREELENSPSPEPEVKGDTKRKFPWYSLLFIIPGAGFIGYPVFTFVKKRKLGLKKVDEIDS